MLALKGAETHTASMRTKLVKIRRSRIFDSFTTREVRKMTGPEETITAKRSDRDLAVFLVLYILQLFCSFAAFGIVVDVVLTRLYGCTSYGGEWDCLDPGPVEGITLFVGIILAIVVLPWGLARVREGKLAYWLPLPAIALVAVTFACTYGYAVFALSDPASRFSF
ncbi:hypothetical protein [Marisediminicola sp. LYQ134]|uniref:hypothetical protein n=1 Tax=unclassified Marisediminicola TaxID=2618316 RepID=UPI003983CD69